MDLEKKTTGILMGLIQTNNQTNSSKNITSSAGVIRDGDTRAEVEDIIVS